MPPAGSSSSTAATAATLMGTAASVASNRGRFAEDAPRRAENPAAGAARTQRPPNAAGNPRGEKLRAQHAGAEGADEEKEEKWGAERAHAVTRRSQACTISCPLSTLPTPPPSHTTTLFYDLVYAAATPSPPPSPLRPLQTWVAAALGGGGGYTPLDGDTQRTGWGHRPPLHDGRGEVAVGNGRGEEDAGGPRRGPRGGGGRGECRWPSSAQATSPGGRGIPPRPHPHPNRRPDAVAPHPHPPPLPPAASQRPRVAAPLPLRGGDPRVPLPWACRWVSLGAAGSAPGCPPPPAHA